MESHRHSEQGPSRQNRFRVVDGFIELDTEMEERIEVSSSGGCLLKLNPELKAEFSLGDNYRNESICDELVDLLTAMEQHVDRPTGLFRHEFKLSPGQLETDARCPLYWYANSEEYTVRLESWTPYDVYVTLSREVHSRVSTYCCPRREVCVVRLSWRGLIGSTHRCVSRLMSKCDFLGRETESKWQALATKEEFVEYADSLDDFDYEASEAVVALRVYYGDDLIWRTRDEVAAGGLSVWIDGCRQPNETSDERLPVSQGGINLLGWGTANFVSSPLRIFVLTRNQKAYLRIDVGKCNQERRDYTGMIELKSSPDGFSTPYHGKAEILL